MSEYVQAIVKSDTGGFRFTDVQRPVRRTESDILIRVSNISLNRGELDFPWESDKPAGWDAFGIVIETSTDGQGPKIGERVLTWSFSGAWSQYRVVDRANVAIVPESVSAAVAAALPVAGLTALRSLRSLHLQPGQSLAVTGATGGVGHLLVQLAMHAGIKVSAVVHSQRGFDWLQASDVKPNEVLLAKEYPFEGTFDALIDTVGGDLLAHLLDNVVPNGTVLILGVASGQVASIDTTILVSRGIDLISYKDYSPAGEDLNTLLTLVDEKIIKVYADNIGSWDKVIKQDFMHLLAPGKVTLNVPQD
ncbi:TPA: zinc-binding dehydrogenase [Serratia marcescens]|uniref:zinc-binding dehydrogenase n=1 Tax=Klebsiella/Raoultella group TaxID=2890311 RepID=UPI000671DC53|nr:MULTISPECIES: zinc-binding dehydrogenase [Klebsiella/Raoultella group]MCT4738261.1 zinc-binding dehydrogenase [Raoultella ornithinolytica]CTQ14609.1 putative Alcohol dehydrogenase zinc-binding domain protein [Klebsiella variicola]CTQ24648.1 putative Alcohol dehydrogenase zinc-binding domain protein [Klebsiella variicola]